MGRGFSVHCFWIESYCEDNGIETTQIPLGSSAARHVIEIENGAWDDAIFYDVEVTSILPNSFPHTKPGRAELVFVPPRRTTWVAHCAQIPGNGRDKDDVKLDYAATHPTSHIRIKSHNVQWRESATKPWQNDPANPAHAIEVELT